MTSAAEVLALVALLVAREVAEHVRELRPLRIEAQRRGLEAEALGLEAGGLDFRHLVRSDVFHHDERLVALRLVLVEQIGVADHQRGADEMPHVVETRAHVLHDVGVSRGFVGAGPAEDEILLRRGRRIGGAVGGDDVAAQAGHLVLGQLRDDVSRACRAP